MTLVCATTLGSVVLRLSWYSYAISHSGVPCFTPVPWLFLHIISFAQSSLRTQRSGKEQKGVCGERKGSIVSFVFCYCLASSRKSFSSQCQGDNKEELRLFCAIRLNRSPGRTLVPCHPHNSSRFWSVVSHPEPFSEQSFWDTLYSGRSLPQIELQT